MKAVWSRFLAPLTPGVRALLFALTVSYVVAVSGVLLEWFNLYPLMGLSGPGFWAGRVWPILTYALLPASFFDFVWNWVLILFLGSCLERVWSRHRLWIHCLVSTFGAGLAKVAIDPSGHRLMVGTTPIVLGLLAAWGLIFANERVLLLFLWEMSTRQAAILLGIGSLLLMLPCVGLKTVFIMFVGGILALVCLWLEARLVSSHTGHAVVSERMNRLEL